MLNKLKIIIFIGLISFFVGEIKADEDICEYKTTQEYDLCLKEGKSSMRISFPFFIGNSGRYSLHRCIDNSFKCRVSERAYQLRSEQGDNLIISTGNFGTFIWNPFKEKYSITIPKERILRWSFVNNVNWDNINYRKYSLNFLDSSFTPKKIVFGIADFSWNYGLGGSLEGDVVSEFLSAITNMNVGEERNKDFINNLIKNEIKNLIKKQEIITAIIQVQNSDLKNCIELKKLKFPELTERVKNIEQKIYSLRSKIDLPPSTDRKPICK